MMHRLGASIEGKIYLKSQSENQAMNKPNERTFKNEVDSEIKPL